MTAFERSQESGVFASGRISYSQNFSGPFCSSLSEHFRFVYLPLLSQLIGKIVVRIQRVMIVGSEHVLIELNDLFILSFGFSVFLLVLSVLAKSARLASEVTVFEKARAYIVVETITFRPEHFFIECDELAKLRFGLAIFSLILKVPGETAAAL